MRLFVGIDVPAAVAEALVRAGPGAAVGISCIAAEDLHLTLHFIGRADAQRVQAALASVSAPPFSLEIAGLGQFRMRGGRRILWAGVRREPGLLGLHRRVGSALAGTGLSPETRPYLPHVTLARIARGADGASIEALIDANEEAGFGRFDVNEFILYDTAPADSGVRYRRLNAYPLSRDTS